MSIPIYNPEEILAEFGGRERFAEYVRLVFAENQRTNIVSRETTEDDLYKLIADCLFPFSAFCDLAPRLSGPTGARALDIGSGGGLPALPLGVAFEGAEFTLIERTQKKARFLESAMKSLGVSGSVIAEDFAEAVRGGKLPEGGFDLATMRWVKLDSHLLDLFARFVRPGGKFVYFSPVSDDLTVDERIWEIDSRRYLLSGDERDSRTVTVFTRISP